MSKFNSLNKAKTDEDLKELINEHKQLVKVLESPSHEDDNKEADKQDGELKEYEKELEKITVEKAVLTHQLQRDYEHIADTVKNFPPKETLNVLSLPNTAKVIDIDKIWAGLMNPDTVKGGEGSGKKKKINLTTKEKSEKHFNNLEEEKRKQAVKGYSKEQIDSAYDDLLQKEKQQDSLTSHFDSLIEPKKTNNVSQKITEGKIKENKQKAVSINTAVDEIVKNIKSTSSLQEYKTTFTVLAKNHSSKLFKDFKKDNFSDKKWRRLYHLSTGSPTEE